MPLVLPRSDLSVNDALIQHRSVQGIETDSHIAASWSCKLGPFVLRLPNFKWRKAAINRHDLHHILTGIPCTLEGECQMANWEFASGRLPSYQAILFCLPLVWLGVLLCPRKTYHAYCSGCDRVNLYDQHFNSTDTLEEVWQKTWKKQTKSTSKKITGYLFLVTLSLIYTALLVIIQILPLLLIFT